MARYYNNSPYYDYLQHLSFPIHFSFFLAILFLFLSFTWYVSYESKYEEMMNQLKLLLMIFPVVMLLMVHWMSSENTERVSFAISLPEKDSLHRVGGSPLGVSLLLVFLIFMISHQASFQERWFPLFADWRLKDFSSFCQERALSSSKLRTAQNLSKNHASYKP